MKAISLLIMATLFISYIMVWSCTVIEGPVTKSTENNNDTLYKQKSVTDTTDVAEPVPIIFGPGTVDD